MSKIVRAGEGRKPVDGWIRKPQSDHATAGSGWVHA
jgi:hypothetical protein